MEGRGRRTEVKVGRRMGGRKESGKAGMEKERKKKGRDGRNRERKRTVR